MKRIVFILSLLWSVAAHAQPLPNHTFVNQQYRWVGGVFNNELKVPGYSGFPYTKPLTHSPMNGDIGYDSVNHRFYFRSGGTYRRLADSAFVMTNALNFANSNLTFTGNRQHDFDNNTMDWLNVSSFQVYSDASSTTRLLLNSTNSDMYSPNQSGSVGINNVRVAINGPDSVKITTDKLLVDSLPQTTDTTSWKQLVWNRTTNEVREFPYFVGGSGSGDLTYAVFEDTCLIITDGAGSDTVCFSGGSGVQYAEFLDSIAAIRQLVVDSAAAIRADFPAASGGNPFADNTDLVKGSADATKLLRFEVDGFTTGTTRTWTVPDVNGTLARSDAAQTFTGVQTFSSNPTFSATSANRVLYTTTGGAITSTANFNFDGSFGRLAGQWSIGATHSGTANRNFEVTGYVNYANATAISGFIPYQQYGGWDGIGTISPSANILAVGGYRASQWVGVNLYTGGTARLTITTGLATWSLPQVLAAGTATAATAPLKFTSGTNLTTGEAGAMEYNGTSLFFTPTGTTRLRHVLTDNSIPSNGQIPIGNGTNYTNATITAGASISITNGPGSISIANAAPGFTAALVSTTNATPTTIATIATLSNEFGVVEVTMVGHRTTADGHGITGKKIVRYRNVGGTITIGSITNVLTDELTGLSTATWTITSSGTNILIQVTGEAATNIDWSTKYVQTVKVYNP